MRITITALCLLLVCTATCRATARYGRIVYVQTADKTIDGKPQVYERDLDTGKTRLLVPHSTVPGVWDWVSLSPDGNYLLFSRQNSEDKNHPMHTDNGAETSRPAGPGLWALDLRKRTEREISRQYEWDGARWSSTSRYILVDAPYDDPQPPPYVYDMVTGKLRRVAVPAGSYVKWAPDEDLYVGMISKKGMTLLTQSPDGSNRRKVLFSPVVGEVSSLPGGRYLVIERDNGKLRWLDLKTARTRDIDLTPQSDTAAGGFEYPTINLPSGKLALFQSYDYGEPHINQAEKLWLLDMHKGTASRVAYWYAGMLGYFTGDDRYGSHSLLGASSDGSWAIVSETTHWRDYSRDVDQRMDRQKVWAISLDHPNTNGRLLFDSGEGCLALFWWPGPKSGH